jgi:hypothetical protein
LACCISSPLLSWSLVPFWADDLAIGNRLISALRDGAHLASVSRSLQQAALFGAS